MESGGYVYDIARLGGVPCGYSAVRPEETGLFLSKLYVKKDCRGCGVARAMMARIEALARRRGADRIRLTCNKRNTASLAAYQRLGFVVVSPVVTDIGGGFVMDD